MAAPAPAAERCPPEILAEIVQYFGPLPVLRDLRSEQRKEAKHELAIGSLVCKDWAQRCRPKAFDTIQIKGNRTIPNGYESLGSFASLVSETPKTLQPVSEYVKTLYLYREIDETDWYDRIKFNTKKILQLSRDLTRENETCAVFLPHAEIYAHTGMHTFEAILAGQRIPVADPRRPSHKSPLFCHRMILERVYLASLPESLHFLLKSFRCVGNSIDLDMTEVNWIDDRETRRPVCPLLDVNMKISAMDCTSPIEPVWSAFTQIGASSIYYMDPSGERPSALLLYTSDLDIISNASQFLFTSLCVVRDLSEYVTRLQVFRGPLNEVEEENGELASFYHVLVA